MKYELEFLNYWGLCQCVKYLKEMNIDYVAYPIQTNSNKLCFNCSKEEYNKFMDLLEKQEKIVKILDKEVEDNGDLLRTIWNLKVTEAFKNLEEIKYSVDDYRPLVEDSVLDLYEIAHYCLKYNDNLGWEELKELVK